MVVQRQRLADARGYFSRFFCSDELFDAGFRSPIAQINHTLTGRKGAVRGLHFQHPPHAEVKFVSCLKGEILDVAVDLRAGSPTFLHWHAEILSAGNQTSLLIPQGFAHGFQTLSENCELLYLHSCAHAAGSEGALNVSDPMLAINWPLPMTDVSVRDLNHSLIAPDFTGVRI